VIHLFGIVCHLASLKASGEILFALPGTASGCHFAKADQNKKADTFLQVPAFYTGLYL
jgi:hypothetical protein